jgi:hypothetical protein
MSNYLIGLSKPELVDRIKALESDVELLTNMRDDVVSQLYDEQKRIDELEAKVERLRLSKRAIRCPDSAGGKHRWDGDGQCLECCNYATDALDKALAATRENDDAA